MLGIALAVLGAALAVGLAGIGSALGIGIAGQAAAGAGARSPGRPGVGPPAPVQEGGPIAHVVDVGGEGMHQVGVAVGLLALLANQDPGHGPDSAGQGLLQGGEFLFRELE